ncbi:MAG TPA: ABC transporter permease [Candidatus Sulfotelmatobacter sp.]|nr:ABC transporter permease [Candidatus Sulfotelmatobacter sp.]
MNALRQTWIVFEKELRDGRRDRRSIMSVLLVAALMPTLFGAMFTVMANRAKDADQIKLPVVGAENAPAFVDWLQQQSGVTVAPAPADPEEAVRSRKEDVVLIIDKDFSKDLARAVPAPVKLVSDSTRDSARRKVERVRTLVTAYSSQLAALRLIARGVAPALAQSVKIEDVEVSSAQERLAERLNILTLLLVIAAATGGMQVAIDTTAGERERGSLEPLLLNPVPRIVLAAGKWLAAAVFACSSVLFSLLLTVNVLRRVPWQDLGIRFRVSDADLMSLLALVLPLAFLLSAVVIFASTFARSFKEAQGYMGMLILLPLVPGVVSTLYPMANRPWLAPVPVFGQYALAADVLGGKAPGVALYILAGASALGCGIVLMALTSRLLSREAIIFGR